MGRHDRARRIEGIGVSGKPHKLPTTDRRGIGQLHVIGLVLAQRQPLVEYFSQPLSHFLSVGAVQALGALLLEAMGS